jgi:AGZA family xanthine/uracil permease-like MFS transporter
MGVAWPAALGAVFISGCLFMLVRCSACASMIVNGIPHSLRVAITVGLGMFLALIALKNAGIVVGSEPTLVKAGDLHKPEAIMAIVGFLLIVTLDRLKVRGAILIGIIVVTVLSFFFGGNRFNGIFSAPPSIDPTLFKLDIPRRAVGRHPERGAGVLPGRTVRRHRHPDGRGQPRRPAGRTARWSA